MHNVHSRGVIRDLIITVCKFQLTMLHDNKAIKGKESVHFYLVVSLARENISYNRAIIQTNGRVHMINWHYGIPINTQSVISVSLSGIVDRDAQAHLAAFARWAMIIRRSNL